MPSEVSSLYWAPQTGHFVCVSPDFDARSYGFVRHHVHVTRWFAKDVFQCIRAYKDERFKTVSTAAMEQMALRLQVFDESYAALPPAEGVPDMPLPPGQVLKQYQRAGIYLMWKLLQGATRKFPRGVLLADEMGLGKTVQAIVLANTVRAARVLVVCPAALKINWTREISAWAVGAPKIRQLTGGYLEAPADWDVVSYTAAIRKDVRGFIMDQIYDLVIVDEAHYCKTVKAERSKAVIGTTKTLGFISRAARTVFITGTPVPNRPVESWNFIWPFVLDHFPIKTKTQWDSYYGVFAHTQFGRKYVRAKNVGDLNTRLRCGYMVRRMKAQVAHELPPKQHKMVVFPASIGGEIKEILKEEGQFNVEEVLKHAIPRGSALATLRRRMGLAKVSHAVEYIDALMEEVEKVVVFAHHTEVVEKLAESLGAYGSVVVMGSTPMLARQKAVDKFQTDPACRVFIGNIEAAGVGLTLTAASNVVFVEHSWVPAWNVQAADRVHRIGQAESVVIHDLVVEGSLDGKVLLAGAKKTKEIEELLA